MRFNLICDIEMSLHDFLKKNHFSKRIIPKIKYSILVNGVHKNLDYPLKLYDIITVNVESLKQNIEEVLGDIDIVYEDKYFIILNKPYDLNTIPSKYNFGIINYLKSYLKDSSIHVVTRLDKDTTGLVLIAKNPYIHACFEYQLQNKLILKKYYAITDKLLNDGIIELPILKTELGKRIVDENGIYAKTEYKLVKMIENSYLYEIILHTGKTHQIRVHFAFLGASLLGDEMYLGDMSYFKRQALHCGYLKFIHPVYKNQMEFKIDLPLDFKEYMNK